MVKVYAFQANVIKQLLSVITLGRLISTQQYVLEVLYKRLLLLGLVSTAPFFASNGIIVIYWSLL